MSTDIDFPCCLDGVLVAGYSASEGGHFQINETQTGPVRLEFLTDARPMSVSVSWSMSAFDFQMFEAWFRTVINYGTISFNADLWIGAGLISHECTFINPNTPYTWANVGKRFRITAELMAVQHEYNDDCESESLLALCGITSERDTCAFLDEFQEYTNVNLPDAWETMLDNLGTDYS